MLTRTALACAWIALTAVPAFAETCFENKSEKSVWVKLEGVVVPDAFELQPGASRCSEQYAHFKLYADFSQELNDYFYNDLRGVPVITQEPPTWRKRYLAGLIETGPLVVDSSQSGRSVGDQIWPFIVYSGPQKPFASHMGHIIFGDALTPPDARIEIFLTEDLNVRTSIIAPPAPAPVAQSCAAQTVARAQSDHSFVRFLLPEGAHGQDIRIPGGAHVQYYFPTCHRVHWNDHAYRCDNGQWRRTVGEAGADILCHGGAPDSPYVEVGYR